MSSLKFYIVDVFAQDKFTGNQVVVVEHEEPLAVEKMQEIAREMNFPETSFVNTEKKDNEGYDVRIFTPNREVSFSGHPTLGTAFIVNHFFSVGLQKEIKLNLVSGQVSINTGSLGKNDSSSFISKSKPVLISGQKKPTFGHVFDPVLLSRVVNLDLDEIDQKYPIQAVYIGIGFIIVPVKRLESISRIKINSERYDWLIARTDAKCILAFCPETVEPINNFHVRVFASYYGIPEDTATGSGNGGLAAYLAHYNYLNTKEVSIRVEQGYEIGRPSLLLANAIPDGEDYLVDVGGRVILVAQGEILI